MSQIIIEETQQKASLTVMGDELAFWRYTNYIHNKDNCQISFYCDNMLTGYINYNPELDDVLIYGEDNDV